MFALLVSQIGEDMFGQPLVEHRAMRVGEADADVGGQVVEKTLRVFTV